MKRKHPDAALTLSEAFEKHYPKQDLAPATLVRMRVAVTAWEVAVGKVPVGEITSATALKFREARQKRPGFVPADMWRCLLVVAYFTGLRKSDLFSLELAAFDLERAVLTFTAGKTRKPIEFPLHPCVIEHVKKIWSPRKLLFEGMASNNGYYAERLRAIFNAASVPLFGLHDLRRTGASECERAKPGMASVFLQHRQVSVTHTSYLNQMEELREAILAMRVPIAFKHGIAQAERELDRAKVEREAMMRDATFTPPYRPDPSEWMFDPRHPDQKNIRYCFRGEWFFIGRTCGEVLKLLAMSKEPVDQNTLAKAVYWNRPIPDDYTAMSGRVGGVISLVRTRLRRDLDMQRGLDPVPCVERNGGNPKWTLLVPPAKPSRKGGAA